MYTLLDGQAALALESIEVKDMCTDGGEELFFRELDQSFPDKMEETIGPQIMNMKLRRLSLDDRDLFTPSADGGVNLPSEARGYIVLRGYRLGHVCKSQKLGVRSDPNVVSCGQNTLTRDFFSTLSSLCTHHIVAQGVARRVCIKHVLPHISAFVVSLFCLLPLSLVPLHSLPLLPVLCPGLQLPCCRDRQT